MCLRVVVCEYLFFDQFTKVYNFPKVYFTMSYFDYTTTESKWSLV